MLQYNVDLRESIVLIIFISPLSLIYDNGVTNLKIQQRLRSTSIIHELEGVCLCVCVCVVCVCVCVCVWCVCMCVCVVCVCVCVCVYIYIYI